MLRIIIGIASSVMLLLAGGYAFTNATHATLKPATPVYSIPHATFAHLHIGMSEDSAYQVFRVIALRRDTLHVDSLLLIESDSVRIFGQAAYIQAQILHHKIRTIVINYHPLSADKYLNVRDVIDNYMQRLFGRGVEEVEESLTHHRWETEEGTMEVSHSDKYERIFIRLGKPRE